jgi:asparagine synthase (glutamine-hydrolysing)
LLTILKKTLFEAVKQCIGKETSLAIAFSGGLDSSLLAKICKDIGIVVTLLTIGFPKSQDIKFSAEIALEMNLPYKVMVLNEDCFHEDINHVKNKICCSNVSHIENCVAFFYLARLAHDNDFRFILTANGCDELFCGYDKYRLAYNQGKTAIMKLMQKKIVNEFQLLKEVDIITSEFGVTVKQPFFSRKFISFAKNIPLEQKITGANDFLRKHILRDIALSIGVPYQSAMKRKKAIQYGSLIHKHSNKYKKVRALHS